MVSILGSFDVHSPEHGKLLKVNLVEGLDNAHLDYIDQRWRPVIAQRRNLALLQYFLLPEASQTEQAFRDILARLGIADEHWDWRKKCSFAAGTKRQPYAVLCGGEVEAVMMLQYGHKARLGAAGDSLVYVEFLSTAPWNRRVIQFPQRFRGLSKLMLGTAVAVSRMQNCDGRCGLHSLPSAEGVYRRYGMAEFGLDPTKDNLRYFEFDEQAAHAFTG
ncbi:hypothetical protein [Burkholderia pyrrocinia]|uniref:hypothetical protein n=1 Tax=Burkholderia pyrrocinia TaxID=60550 RepID=UPI002AB2D35E|nr:hypothetical protein [Burkholderia pyrrocinia]